MIVFSFHAVSIFLTVLWVLVRVFVCLKQGAIRWKRELQLLLVYICIMVVARVTFFPFSKVDGQVQPLIFDKANALNFQINLIPLAYLFDYETKREAIINVIGNTTMFIPIGIVWPIVYKELNKHWTVIAAGVGFSLTIELLQLPFYGRHTDIDDLLLNSIGFLIGYGIYLLVKKCRRSK